MKTFKQLRPWIAEAYLIISVLCYWLMTGTLFNPIAIILLSIFAMLILWKNKGLGVTIGIGHMLLNLYMILAMISELNQFEIFNRRAWELLLFGSIYFGTNITASVALLKKWGQHGLTKVIS